MSTEKSDLEKIKSFIINLSEKVNQYKLRNLLILTAAVTLGLSTCMRNIPVAEYDCSDKGDSVAKMIISCEEQKTNAQIKEMEMELEEKKLDARTKLEKIVEVIRMVNWENAEDRQSFLKSLSSESMRSLKAIAMRKSCSEQMIESMCRVVKK